MSRELKTLCLQLRISEDQAMSALVLEGRTIISDECVFLSDVAEADIPAAAAFLRSRFGPDQPTLL